MITAARQARAPDETTRETLNDSPALVEHRPPPTAGATLDHLALYAVRGPDARAFLDSQLTRDVPQSLAGAVLAGYCSPKGRLLASVVLWATDDTVWLMVSRDIAEPLVRRLRMYVLRAKVTFDDVGASRWMLGRGAVDSAADLLPWQVTRVGDRTWLRFPDVGSQRRYLEVASHEASAGDAIDAAHWRWLDIRAGLPRITVATQDRFVPQMLNLEALGAVDFKKGCFPGQEIVARSQYLGKLKRRMALATTAAPPPPPGTDVWNVGDREPCGVVVNAEAGPDGRTSLLVEMPVASFDAATLRLASPEGPVLTVEPLPYALPDTEVFVRPKR